jgi:DNA-binding transcriptional LysR family regulator
MNVTVLYQIEVFRAVMKTGTMTAAARLLNISQPSVTKHIHSLEGRLNGKLFVKEGRAVRPTSVALRLQDEADVMFSLANNIERIVDSFSRAAKRSIRIGIPPILSSKFLIDVLDKVGKDRPKYDLYVTVKDSQLLKGLIASGLLDVAVVGDHVYRKGISIGRNPLICAMNIEHPLAHHSHVELADLIHHDYIAFEKESPMQLAIEAAARDMNVRILPRIVASTTPTLLGFVGHGLGVAIVHPFAVLGSAARLVVRPFEPQIMWEYKVIHSTTIRNSLLVEAFVKAINEVSQEWTQRSIRLSSDGSPHGRTAKSLTVSKKVRHGTNRAKRVGKPPPVS